MRRYDLVCRAFALSWRRKLGGQCEVAGRADAGAQSLEERCIMLALPLAFPRSAGWSLSSLIFT